MTVRICLRRSGIDRVAGNAPWAFIDRAILTAEGAGSAEKKPEQNRKSGMERISVVLNLFRLPLCVSVSLWLTFSFDDAFAR